VNRNRGKAWQGYCPGRPSAPLILLALRAVTSLCLRHQELQLSGADLALLVPRDLIPPAPDRASKDGGGSIARPLAERHAVAVVLGDLVPLDVGLG
jgi:hypothetical protein